MEAPAGGQVRLGRVHLRLATAADAPQVQQLIVRLARFHDLEHECFATADKLLATVFGLPGRAPFEGPTVVLAEVSGTPLENGAHTGEKEGAQNGGPQKGGSQNGATGEAGGETEFEASFGAGADEGTLVEDPDRGVFVSTRDPARTVVAFALAYSNYSTFLTTPGLWLEDLYVREPYRRFGMGTRLLRYLTRVAYAQKMGRVDWSVIAWNEKAINFYTKKMGAKVLNDWRICRLEGKTLEAAAKMED